MRSRKAIAPKAARKRSGAGLRRGAGSALVAAVRFSVLASVFTLVTPGWSAMAAAGETYTRGRTIAAVLPAVPARPVEAAPPETPAELPPPPPEPPGAPLVPGAADTTVPPSGDALVEPTFDTPPIPEMDIVRLRAVHQPFFGVAIGMGVSRDSSGLVEGRTVAIPAFQVQLGAGEGPLGFETRLFSNQASGHFHQKTVSSDGATTIGDMAVDRIALDVMFAFRPLALGRRDSGRWRDRALRAVALNLGFGFESASVGPPSALRLGPVIGLHVDLPLTPATDSAADLRVRLSARRLFAGDTQVGSVKVSDSKEEIFGGLALVF